MIEALKSWVLTVITAIFFMTAIELLLPNSSLKKYSKFVFGIIIMTLFLNPILKLYDKNYEINMYKGDVTKAFNDKKYQEDYEKYKKKSIESTMENFKLNIQTSCEKKLKEKYPTSNYKVQVNAFYNEKNKTVDIKELKVGVKDGAVEKIKKVKMNPNSKSVTSLDTLEGEKGIKIKEYLSTELKVSKDMIEVYKL